MIGFLCGSSWHLLKETSGSLFSTRKRLQRFIFVKNISHCNASSQAHTNLQPGGADVNYFGSRKILTKSGKLCEKLNLPMSDINVF